MVTWRAAHETHCLCLVAAKLDRRDVSDLYAPPPARGDGGWVENKKLLRRHLRGWGKGGRVRGQHHDPALSKEQGQEERYTWYGR